MRIAFIVDRFPAMSQTFVLRQMIGMMERGHEVTVFADAPGGDAESHEEVARYGLLEKTRYFAVASSLVGRLKGGARLTAAVARRSPAWLLSLVRCLNPTLLGREALSLRALHWYVPFMEGEFDVLQAHFAGSGVVGAVLKALGVPGKLVTHFHGYGVRIAQRSGGGGFKRLFRQGDWFLANSRYTYRQLLALGVDPAKLSVLYPGVVSPSELFDHPRQGQKRDSGDKIKIVTVARLVDIKGVDVGLKVFKDLVEALEALPALDLEYHLVGDGPCREELRLQVARDGLDDKVVFHGSLPFHETLQVVQGASFYLLPSREEAFGLASLEAQASGVPVVAFRVGGVGETMVSGETGFLVSPRDRGDMVEKARLLATNPTLRVEMGRRGRLWVKERFGVESQNAKLEELYQRLLDEGDGSRRPESPESPGSSESSESSERKVSEDDGTLR